MRTAYIATSSALPVDSGQRRRIHAIWRALSALGEVDFVAFDLRPPLSERAALARAGITILPPRIESAAFRNLRHLRSFLAGDSMLVAKWLSPRRLERLSRRLAERRPELVLLGDAILAPLIEPLRPVAARLMIDTHNVDSLLYRRIYRAAGGFDKLKNYAFYRNLLHIEKKLALADKVWAVSERDASYYRDVLGIAHTCLVPNIIDLDEYRPDETPVEDGSIVLTGNFGYWPNEDAALRLIRMARRFPERRAMFRIVGRGPTRRMLSEAQGLTNVEITGPVADVRPYLRKAAIVAAPLQAGSGTKFKVLEAMALGKPVVTTPLGAEGLDLASDLEAVVASDEAAFSAVLASLVQDRGRRMAIGKAARRFVERNCARERLTSAVRSAVMA